MNVAVFGLGYVGCVTAACLARNGHIVIGVDVSEDKVSQINAGQSPIVEPGLEALIRGAVERDALRATTSAMQAVLESEVALICVGTPGTAHGQPSFDAVRRVASDIGAAVAAKSSSYVVVLRSTALPGTAESVVLSALRDAAGTAADDIAVAVNPEFMREGAAIEDFDHPPFVIVGADDPGTAAVVARVYESVDAPLIATGLRTAELVKYASNAFHALKICFANEMADVAGALGCDGLEVMRIFALDRKLNISPAYLKPGFAFGGSCLPKDVRAIVWAGRVRDVDTPVLSAILPSNDQQLREAIDTILRFGRRRVGVVGLAFKAGTDDLRESPMVTLVEALLGKGLDVRILDGDVSIARLVGANRRYIETEVPHIASLLCADASALVAHAEIIVVGTKAGDAQAVLAAATARHTIIDLTRPRAESLIQAVAPQEADVWTAKASSR